MPHYFSILFHLRPCGRCANCRATGRQQEVACGNLAVGSTFALNEAHIHTLEAAVGPYRTCRPRVAAELLRAAQTNLGGVDRAGLVFRRNIVVQCRHSCLKVVPNISVVVRSVAEDYKVARLAVIREALCGVGKRNAVGDVVVCGSDVCGVTASKLEAVAIAGEISKVPAVEAVAPRDCVDDCNLGLELPICS